MGNVKEDRRDLSTVFYHKVQALFSNHPLLPLPFFFQRSFDPPRAIYISGSLLASRPGSRENASSTQEFHLCRRAAASSSSSSFSSTPSRLTSLLARRSNEHGTFSSTFTPREETIPDASDKSTHPRSRDIEIGTPITRENAVCCLKIRLPSYRRGFARFD